MTTLKCIAQMVYLIALTHCTKNRMTKINEETDKKSVNSGKMRRGWV